MIHANDTLEAVLKDVNVLGQILGLYLDVLVCPALGWPVDVFESVTDTSILNKEPLAEPSGKGEDEISARPLLSSHFWWFWAAAFFSMRLQFGF